MKSFWLGALLCLATLASAQTPASDKGFFGTVAYGTSHDNSIGWTSESDYAAGYDFSRHVSMDIGVPVWLVATTNSTSTSGTTTQTTKSGVLGDVFVGWNYDPKFKSFSYRTSIIGTLPTGNTDLGVSTGRAGITWMNHIEKDFGPLTPFVEAGFSNQQGSTSQFKRSYTVLGKNAQFRAGADVDLTHRFSFEVAAYDNATFGTQKIYSRIIPRNGGMVATGKKGRPFASNAVTVGSSSIGADHGFGAGLSYDATRRFGISLDYNRSVPQSLDSIGITIAYRFGHLIPLRASK